MDWNVMKVGSMLTSRWSLTGSGWNQIRSRVFSAASGWWHSMRFGHQIKVFQQSETWHKNVIFIYIYILLFNLQKHSSFSHLQVGPRAKNGKQKMWVVTEKHMPLECKIEQTLSRRWGKKIWKTNCCPSTTSVALWWTDGMSRTCLQRCNRKQTVSVRRGCEMWMWDSSQLNHLDCGTKLAHPCFRASSSRDLACCPHTLTQIV